MYPLNYNSLKISSKLPREIVQMGKHNVNIELWNPSQRVDGGVRLASDHTR